MERDLGMILRDVLDILGAGPRIVDVTNDEWDKAALAVAENALKNAEDEWQKQLAAEELIIEAAKAHVRQRDEVSLLDLALAVEALEAKEG